MSEIVKKVGDLKDSRNPLNNFFLYSLEVAQSVLWIISPMPVPTAESFIETSSFYGNKILREKQEHQVAWVKGFNDVIKANIAFVKDHCALGIMWNAQGKNFIEALNAPQGGEEVKQAPVAKKVEEVKAPAKVVKKEPKKYERGISWIFEHYEGVKTLELPPEETGMKKAVMVDNCTNCVIQIKGKVKSIIVSGCKGTSLVCQDVVSGIELINCQKLQLQSTGKVPSVSIDKTDGVQIYVAREFFEEMMFSTSKSADMNVVVPGVKPDDDMIEIPIPHQFVHRIDHGKIKSSPSDLYSH